MAGIHKVVQGEHLFGIARKYGFPDWKKIWNHGQNAELKELRKNPNVLFPGDELLFPIPNRARRTAPPTICTRSRPRREAEAADRADQSLRGGIQEYAVRADRQRRPEGIDEPTAMRWWNRRSSQPSRRPSCWRKTRCWPAARRKRSSARSRCRSASRPGEGTVRTAGAAGESWLLPPARGRGG